MKLRISLLSVALSVAVLLSGLLVPASALAAPAAAPQPAGPVLILRPDLVIQNVHVMPFGGHRFLVFTVRNVGLAPAGPSVTRVQFYRLAPFVNITHPIATAPLAPGAAITYRLPIPDGPSVQYKIRVDATFVVNEGPAGELNNAQAGWC